MQGSWYCGSRRKSVEGGVGGPRISRLARRLGVYDGKPRRRRREGWRVGKGGEAGVKEEEEKKEKKQEAGRAGRNRRPLRSSSKSDLVEKSDLYTADLSQVGV